jgi:hypothetical protein
MENSRWFMRSVTLRSLLLGEFHQAHETYHEKGSSPFENRTFILLICYNPERV